MQMHRNPGDRLARETRSLEGRPEVPCVAGNSAEVREEERGSWQGAEGGEVAGPQQRRERLRDVLDRLLERRGGRAVGRRDGASPWSMHPGLGAAVTRDTAHGSGVGGSR